MAYYDLVNVWVPYSLCWQILMKKTIPTMLGVHRKPKSEKDMKMLVQELMPSFQTVGQSRNYTTFPNPRDPLHAKSQTDITNWIISHIKTQKKTM